MPQIGFRLISRIPGIAAVSEHGTFGEDVLEASCGRRSGATARKRKRKRERKRTRTSGVISTAAFKHTTAAAARGSARDKLKKKH